MNGLKDSLSEPVGRAHEETFVPHGVGPRVLDLVSNRCSVIVEMDGGDDHGVVGETVTRLKPLRLVHAERESVGFLSSRAQTRQQLNTLGSTDKYETYLVVERLGVPDPVSPDSRSSRITSEEDRLVRLDASDNSLLEGRGGRVDVCDGDRSRFSTRVSPSSPRCFADE